MLVSGVCEAEAGAASHADAPCIASHAAFAADSSPSICGVCKSCDGMSRPRISEAEAGAASHADASCIANHAARATPSPFSTGCQAVCATSPSLSVAVSGNGGSIDGGRAIMRVAAGCVVCGPARVIKTWLIRVLVSGSEAL